MPDLMGTSKQVSQKPKAPRKACTFDTNSTLLFPLEREAAKFMGSVIP